MSRRRDEPEDDELPEGVYHDDDIPTVPCLYCREEILEDAERCPHCENYISAEDAPPEPRSKFLVIVMIFALLIVVYWVIRG
jgi:hypothetical protein